MESGVFGDRYQLVKSGINKVNKWADRARGLSLLKNIPTDLEAYWSRRHHRSFSPRSLSVVNRDSS